MKLQKLIRRISAARQEEYAFPDDLEKFLADFIPNTLLKSETFQQAFKVSNYEMEEIYAETHAFYQDDLFLESSTGFRWLVLLNPFISKYWMGLGASLQCLEKYEKALHAYAVAALLDSENPHPHLHAYECYAALKVVEDAEKALDLALKRTSGKGAFKELYEEIVLIKKGMHLCPSEYKHNHSIQ